MKYNPIHLSAIGTRTDACAPVRRYVREHRDGLWHAARLLGGYEAAKTVGFLADALEHEMLLSRRSLYRLDALLALLTLENVGDPERPELGYFALIDPTDPAVEEICVLADGLSHAIDQMRQRACCTAGPAHAQENAA